MKIPLLTFISDTHDNHEKLKISPTYLLCHTGDATNRGNQKAVDQFLNWFANQPAIHKIFVPGNHDKHYFNTHRSIADEECRLRGITLLLDDEVWIKPLGIHIYGKACLNRPEDYTHYPDAIDILLTHEPPYRILDQAMGPPRPWEDQDRHLGSKQLQHPSAFIHAFGHIHEGRGWQYTDKLYVNASNTDRITGDIEHPPIIIDAVTTTYVHWETLTVIAS